LKKITIQRVFDWSIFLTQQENYQNLTFSFIEVLKAFSTIEKIDAFEFYAGKQRKTDPSNQGTGQLVRRFPLDFSVVEEKEANFDWLEIFDQVLDVEIKSAKDNQFLLPIKGTIGPDRAIIVYGQLQQESLSVIKNLLIIYHNQVSLHDTKERDVLTQLPNRQTFQNRLMQVCQYFMQNPMQEKNSWIAMLDIDHFKRVNDNFGHLYGDEVLLTFSQLMEKKFRFNDFLFRFGGEEFVVILNLISREDAEKVFNAFREMVAAYIFPTVGTITVSIGVEHIGRKAIPTTLLDRADQALYYAKEHGRNQVVFYKDIAEKEDKTEGIDDVELF